MEGILLPLIVIFLTFVIYLVRKQMSIYNYWKKRGVPHPKPIPFFGNTFSIACGNRSIFHFHLKNYFDFADHKFSGYYDFGKPVLVVRDPELVNQILTKDFAYFQDRGFPYDEEKEPLTANLFNMGGPRWQNVRKKTTSCFTTNKRKLMFAMIIDLMQGLKSTVDKAIERSDIIEIKDILARYRASTVLLVFNVVLEVT